MQRADSLEKSLMLGKTEGRRRRGWQRMRCLDGITDSMDMSLSNSRRWWRTGKPGVLQSMGWQRVRQDWVTKQGTTATMSISFWASQAALEIKKMPANAGDIRDVGLIPGLERYPGGGHCNPFQYSCLENPMDRGVWWAIVHSVPKSWTWMMRQLTRRIKVGYAWYISNVLHIRKLRLRDVMWLAPFLLIAFCLP